MNTDTAQTLNWQLSQHLGLDPSVPHVINAESDCGCYSSWTRDDMFNIWVESDSGRTRVNGYWVYLTDFISALVSEGEPETLDGVAEATISDEAVDSADDGCYIVNRG